jgi:cobalt-zinc-cadmium efflux system membrane fusion protein
MSTPDQQSRLRLAAIAGAVALALGLVACSKESAKDAPAAQGAKADAHAGEKKGEGKDEHAEGASELTLTSEEAERAGIKVEAMKAQALGETVVVTATIFPDQDRLVRVSPRIDGRILSAPAKLGDKVRAGQILATLDSVEVGETHAAWTQAQAELRIAEADFKRAESLNAEEIIPRKDFLRAQADRDKAVAALRAASDRLRLLGGAPGAAGNSVSGFAVTAPFAGTVIEKKVTLGELATPSEPMFTVADLSRVWIQAALPEAALSKVRVGASAKVTVPAYPGETFTWQGRPHRRHARQGHAHSRRAHRSAECRRPFEARNVRHRHHRSGGREARSHLRCPTRPSCCWTASPRSSSSSKARTKRARSSPVSASPAARC